MPSFPIIDTHLHLWDPERISYSWQKGNPLLNRRYVIEDYHQASQGIETEALIFVECHVDEGAGSGQFIREVEFVEGEAQRDPRIRAIVAKAPVERGASVRPILEEMAARFPRLRGIRRIPEFEPEPRAFMLNPNFIEGRSATRATRPAFRAQRQLHTDGLGPGVPRADPRRPDRARSLREARNQGRAHRTLSPAYESRC